MGTITVRVPTAPPRSTRADGAFRHGKPLRGSRVGLRYEGGWHSWNFIVRQWEQFLRADGASVEVLKAPNGRAGAEGEKVDLALNEWAQAIDFGVIGLGTCGSCTAGTIKDAVTLEALRKPSVAAVCEEFAEFGRTMADTLGHHDLQILVLPYPLETRSEDFWREVAVEHYPTFLAMVDARR